jgi:hypothetical protein
LGGGVVSALDVSERSFQVSVTTLARLRGWRLAHFRAAWTKDGWRTAMSGDIGYPDLTMCRGERIVFAELKAADGRLRPDQAVWLEALRETPAEVYCWRPADWRHIERVLR